MAAYHEKNTQSSQQDKEMESMMSKDQSLKDDIANLIQQHDEMQTSSNAQIASLRTTIANYEHKGQRQENYGIGSRRHDFHYWK